MKLNCKPGDLARVMPNQETIEQGCVDKIIRVLQTVPHMFTGKPCWLYEGPLFRCQCGCGGIVTALADYVLCPIRDPGDDAVDEVIIRLGKPISDKETV